MIWAFKDFIDYDFLFYALLATFLLSFVCGLISPLIIARKNAFMGSAISHSTLLGLSVSLVFFNKNDSWAIFFTTLIITSTLTLFLAKATYQKNLPTDSMIGIFYTATMASGMIIHSLFAKTKTDLLSFLFGNILLLTKEDLMIAGFLFVLITPMILIPFSQWIYTTIDEEGAMAHSLHARFFHYLFFWALTLLIVTSVKIAGTLLVETFLLVPGMFALKTSTTIKGTFIKSVLFATMTSLLGLFMANAFSLPSGATLALTQFSIFILFILFLKIKGAFHANHK